MPPNEAISPGETAHVRVGRAIIESFDGTTLTPDEFKVQSAGFRQQLVAALDEAGYPSQADPARINKPMVLAISP